MSNDGVCILVKAVIYCLHLLDKIMKKEHNPKCLMVLSLILSATETTFKVVSTLSVFLWYLKINI